MSNKLLEVEGFAPIIRELRMEAGSMTELMVLVPIRGRDVDLFIDGVRATGVKSIKLKAEPSDGNVGSIRGTYKHANWYAQLGSEVDLELIVHHPTTGEDVDRITKRVKLGEPTSGDERHFDCILTAV